MPADAGRRKVKIGVIGASGYTGADLIRLAACHPHMEISLLAANTHAGKPLSDVFPHLGFIQAPPLVKAEDADWSTCDAVFCGLPHGTAQDIIVTLPGSVKIIDMSADFRLKDTDTYAKWYGRQHVAPHLVQEAAYGLTEFLPRTNCGRATRRLPGMLSDCGAARAPAARQRQAHRRQRHYHRCKVGRVGSWAFAQAEHPVR